MSYINTSLEGYSGSLAASFQDSMFIHTSISPVSSRKQHKKDLSFFSKPYSSFADFLIKFGSIVLAPFLFTAYTVFAACFFLITLVIGLFKLVTGNLEDAIDAFQICLVTLCLTLFYPILAVISPLINFIDCLGSGVNNLVYLFKNNTFTLERNIERVMSLTEQETLLKDMKMYYSGQEGVTYNIESDNDSTKIIMMHTYTPGKEAYMLNFEHDNMSNKLEENVCKKLLTRSFWATTPEIQKERLRFTLDFIPTKDQEAIIKDRLKSAFPKVTLSIGHDSDYYSKEPTIFYVGYTYEKNVEKKLHEIIGEVCPEEYTSLSYGMM